MIMDLLFFFFGQKMIMDLESKISCTKANFYLLLSLCQQKSWERTKKEYAMNHPAALWEKDNVLNWILYYINYYINVPTPNMVTALKTCLYFI